MVHPKLEYPTSHKLQLAPIISAIENQYPNIKIGKSMATTKIMMLQTAHVLISSIIHHNTLYLYFIFNC